MGRPFSLYERHRFPGEIIRHVAWPYYHWHRHANHQAPHLRGEWIALSRLAFAVLLGKGRSPAIAFRLLLGRRAMPVEALFGEAKLRHGLRPFRLRGLAKVNTEGSMTAAGQNLKRWLVPTGRGRRHAPCGALTPRVLPSERVPPAPGRAGTVSSVQILGLSWVTRPLSVALVNGLARPVPATDDVGASCLRGQSG